ncbi:hypothetical protein [Burkholderia cepacia]|uniref:hypothetical protein n=1 Tax=Burkholderia cepacia TaxID=292 RepID=UPI000B26161B|nr:hypothetical protein [Burkholderia cepacia]
MSNEIPPETEEALDSKEPAHVGAPPIDSASGDEPDKPPVDADADREWNWPPRAKVQAWPDLIQWAVVSFFVSAAIVWVAAGISSSLTLQPDQYGILLAVLSAITGLVVGAFDDRPKRIEDMKTYNDEEAKAIALTTKEDGNWCAAGMAAFGLPALLARIYAPAGGSHHWNAIAVTMATFVVFFGATIAVRTTRAEIARQKAKFDAHNLALRKQSPPANSGLNKT